MPAPAHSSATSIALKSIAVQADGLRNRKESSMIGARNTVTQRARSEGYSVGPEDEATGTAVRDMRYPTGSHSLATYLNDGNWRVANHVIFTLLGSIIVTFFTAMGKVWVVEQILVDGIFTATLAHGLFAMFGLYLALSLCGHVVTTFDPFIIFIDLFMPHRTTEMGRNHHKGVHWLSSSSALSGALQIIASLAGSLFAGYMVRAFQFTPSVASVPIPLVAWQRPAFAEGMAAFFFAWSYFVANFEPVFLAANASPASFQAAVFGMLIIFTKPYSGGVVTIGSHFGPSIATKSILNTTKLDATHLYLPIFIGVCVAWLMWFPTLRYSRQPQLASEPYHLLDEEAGTPHAQRHRGKNTDTEGASE